MYMRRMVRAFARGIATALLLILVPAVMAAEVGQPVALGQTLGLDLVDQAGDFLPAGAYVAPEHDPPGLLNDGWLEPMSELAARLSADRTWLRRDVLEVLDERALSVDEIFERAPRYLEINGFPYQVKIEMDGRGWEDFDPTRDRFLVYLTHEVYDGLGEDRALGYEAGEEIVLFAKEAGRVPAFALTLAGLAPAEKPEGLELVQPIEAGSIRLGTPRETIPQRPVSLQRVAGSSLSSTAAGATCDPEVKPTACSGSTISCPSGYTPYFIIQQLRIFDDREGCCFMGAPEVELYSARLDTTTGSGGASNVTTDLIFDGSSATDIAGRSRYLPDVDDDGHVWYSITGGLAVFNASTGTRWGGFLVEDDDTKGKLIVDGGSINVVEVLDKGNQIYNDARNNEYFELIKGIISFIDMIIDGLSNDDDIFRNPLGVTNAYYCSNVHPYGVFPALFTRSTSEWELKGYFACLQPSCEGTSGGGGTGGGGGGGGCLIEEPCEEPQLD